MHKRMTSGKRTFLFLQGHPSSFARELGDHLRARGHSVLRINLCVGDVIGWFGRPAVNFRGSLKEWPVFLRQFLLKHRVSDILYYGDRRPYHRAAALVATELDIPTFTYEFGYLRPDWLTLERGGMATFSHFPNDPAIVREVAAQFGEPDLVPRHRSSVTEELFHELVYHWSTYLLSPFFHRYKAEYYYNPIIEYLTGIPRQLMLSSKRKRANELVETLLVEKREFFLMPLQLQCDSQLRFHSPFAHQRDAIARIIGSFAQHANASARLVFKCHPLDNGGEGWPRAIAALSRESGVSGRVHYIDGGDLEALLLHANGCVLINSTVGLHALRLDCPVKVLGTALYDLKGLTDEAHLDEFWRRPMKPDSTLVHDLIRALAGTIQVKGSFFSPAGRAAAIAVFIERLEARTVNGMGAFVSPPPRLSGTRAH